MAHPYLECDSRMIVGQKAFLTILVWDQVNPDNDLSTATALCAVYNDSNTAVLAFSACGISGTNLLSVQRYFDTTGLPPGEYRALYFLSLGATSTPFQFAFTIDPAPGPQ